MDFLVSAGGIITVIISVFAILAAIILNVRTGAVHFKLIGKIRTRSLSARGTAAASLGMGIGAQNIIAAVFAVMIFGAGAIFWLWVTALIMMAAAGSERTLAAYFRKINPDGRQTGGAYSYLRDGIGSRFGDILAVIFSFSSALFAIYGGGVLQAGAAAQAGAAFGLPAIAVPVILAAICAVMLFIGAKKSTLISGGVSAIAALLIIIASLGAIIANAEKLPEVLGSVFTSILSVKSVLGGIFAGIFCSLAGFGANRMYTSDEPEPVASGSTAVGSVCISGIVIGTLAALGALISDVGFGFEPTGALTFSDGGVLYNAALIVSALAAMLGWSAYGKELYTGKSKGDIGFAIIYLVATVCFATREISAIWSISLIFAAIILTVNLIGLLILSKTAAAVSRNYIKRRVNGDKTIQPMLSYYPDTQYELEKALEKE